MMQQVASPNADVAAFAANTGQNKQNQAGLAGGFGQVLQQQRESSSPTRSNTPATDGTGNDRDKVSSKSADSEVAESEPKDSVSGDDDIATVQEALTRDKKSADGGGSATRDKNEAENPHNGRGEKPTNDDSPSNIDGDIVAPEYITELHVDIEPQLTDNWVSLVGKLQSFANMEQGENSDSLLKTSDKLADTQSDENPLQVVDEGDEAIKQSFSQVAQLFAIEGSLKSLPENSVDSNASSTDSSIMTEQLAQMLKDKGLVPASSETSDIVNQLEQLLANADELALDNKVDQELLALLLNVGASDDPEKITRVEDGLLSSEGLSLENEINPQLLSGLAKSVDGTDAQISNQLQPLNEAQAEVSAQPIQLKPGQIEKTLSLKTDKQPEVDPVDLLVNMSEGKLDKTLNNLAQRILSNTLESSVQGANKQFIAALQSGVAELKSQLAKGREPGIDLPELVADAMSKANISVKQPEQIEVRVKAFTQVVDFAQQLSTVLDVSQARSANALSIESGQIQIEQLKQTQIQTSQLGTQLDKAINIAKPEGHQQLAEKVRWMVNAKQLVADVRLDPAELGSMQIKVSISGESATVNFVVQSHHARDALENATPKLRELLSEQGIELGQSSVRQEQGSDGEQNLSKDGFGPDGEELGDADEQESENLMQQPIINGALGGIDYFV
jgi:flagellar hook-length control protein FliK